MYIVIKAEKYFNEIKELIHLINENIKVNLPPVSLPKIYTSKVTEDVISYQEHIFGRQKVAVITFLSYVSQMIMDNYNIL